MPQTYNISDVMLSYSRKDKPFVQRLEQMLRESGREVWVDWEDIAPTVDWWAEIKAGIEAAHTFVFIMTPHSIRSEICRQEIDHAVTNGKRLVPVLREEINDPVDKARIHPALNQHNWIYMRDGDNFQEGFKTLVTALEADITHAQAHTRLLVRAREWEEGGGGTSRLLRGDDLRAAEAWLTGGLNKSPEPTALQAKYIAQSRKAANRSRQQMMAAAALTIALLGLLSLFGLSQSVAAANEAGNAQTQAAFAQTQAGFANEQAARAQTQEALAIENLETAQAAEKKSKLSDDARSTQQQIANNSKATAQYEQTNAVVLQSTADYRSTQALDLQLTSDMAGTQAFNLEVTAGTNAGNLQVTAQYAATQAAKQAESAAAVGTQAAEAQKQANAANIQAANAQGTANANAASAARAGTQAAEALTQVAIAQVQATANAATAAAANANATRAAQTSIAGQQTAIVINAKSTQAAQTATSAAATASANAVTATIAALTATYSHGTATQSALNATQAYLSGQTATVVAIDIQTTNLMNSAVNALTYDSALAIHLALLAVDRPGAPMNPSPSTESTFNMLVYSGGNITVTQPSTVSAIAFSADGKMASGLASGVLSLLDMKTGAVIRTFPAYVDPIMDVDITADGTKIIVAGIDYGSPKNVQLWDTKTGQLLWKVAPSLQGPLSVEFSPDEKQVLVSTFFGNKLYLLDINDGKITRVINSNHGAGHVNSVSFNPQGTKIVSASSDGTVRLIDISTAAETSIKLSNVSSMSVSFSSDGTKIIIAGTSGIEIWDSKNNARLRSFASGLGITKVVMSPDGNTIVSGSSDTTVRLWDANTGIQIGNPFTNHTSSITSVAFSPDGKSVASASADGTVRLWHINNGPFIRAISAGGNIHSVSITKDGKQLASGSQSDIHLWNANTGELITSGYAPGIPMRSLALSPDGEVIAVVSASGEFSTFHDVRLLDAETKQLKAVLPHLWIPTSAAFSSDSKKLVTGEQGDSQIHIWDVDTGNETLKFISGRYFIYTVAFSTDGTMIASGSGNDSKVDVWDVKTHDNIRSFSGHSAYIQAVAFSPDGTKVVSASADQTIRLWSISTGQQIGLPIIGHTAPVKSIAFSPDGTKIVSASEDQTVRVWDITTGRQFGPTLTGHTASVNSVVYNGTKIVSGSTDGTIRIWLVRNMKELIEFACANSYIRPLTAEEKVLFGITTDHRCATDAVLPSANISPLVQELSAPPQPDMLPEIALFSDEIPERSVLTLPVYSSMDDGALNWTVEGGWVLSEAGSFGEIGQGWIIDAASGEATLHMLGAVGLTGAVAPSLKFQSRLTDDKGVAMVQIRVNEGDWQLLQTLMSGPEWRPIEIDLSPYRDQSIELDFVWLSDAAPIGGWSIDDLIIADQLLATETSTLSASPSETPFVDPMVLETPTVESVPAIETPTLSLAEWTPIPTSTLLEMTPTTLPSPTLIPLHLPVTANMDNGALDWIATGGWALSETDRHGVIGKGWVVTSSQATTASLNWGQAIDLSGTITPRLRFASQRIGAHASAIVQVSIDGMNWQFLSLATQANGWQEQVVDLSIYQGQLIYLQWVWISSTEGESWAIDEVIVEEAPVLPTPSLTPSPTMTLTLTDTPWPTETATEIMIPVETDIPTEIPIEIPTDIPTPLSTAESS